MFELYGVTIHRDLQNQDHSREIHQSGRLDPVKSRNLTGRAEINPMVRNLSQEIR